MQISFINIKQLIDMQHAHNEASAVLLIRRNSGGFQSTYLLLEVAPLLLINENQVEVVAHRKLLVDVPHGRRHLVAREEQPDGDGLSYRTNANWINLRNSLGC